MALLFASLLLLPLEGHAIDPAPGATCAVTGARIFSGGPELSGVGHWLVCDGANWRASFTSDASGLLALGTTSVGAGARVEVSGGALRLSQQSASVAGELQLAELLANGTNTVAFRAPSNLGNSLTFQLPAVAGTVGHVLTLTGSGTLGFAAASAGTTFPLLSTTLGSVGAPAYSFSADSDTGLFSPGANTLGFSTAGTLALNIGHTGRVGIGTNAPEAALDVRGKYVADGIQIRSEWPTLYLDSTAGADRRASINFSGAGGSHLWEIATDFPENDTQDFFIRDRMAYQVRFHIDSQGRVGLGTTTSATGTRLDVTGGAIRASQQSASAAGEVQFGELLANGTNTVALRAPSSLANSLTFQLPSVAGTVGHVLTLTGSGTMGWVAAGGGVTFPLLSTTLGSAGTPVYSFNADSDTGLFSPGANTLALSTSGTQALTILPNGFVGIGTPTPTSPLTIRRDGSGTSNALTLANLSPDVGNWPMSTIVFQGTTGLPTSSVNGGWAGNTSNGVLTLHVSQSGSLLERFRIYSNGATFLGNSDYTPSDAHVSVMNESSAGNTVHSALNLFVMDSDSAGSSGFGNRLGFFTETSSSNVFAQTAAFEAVLDDATNGSKDGSLRFLTLGPNAAAGVDVATEKMRVDSSGQVSIGTTAAASGVRLDVVGGAIRASQQSASAAGEVQFAELLANGTNTVALRARGTLANSLTWLLPDSLGSDGQALTVGSGGTMYWSTPSATVNYPLLSTTRGSAANPAYSFSADSDTGIFSSSASNVSITTGGTTRFVSDISTTSVLNPSGQTNFLVDHVNPDVYVFGFNRTPQFKVVLENPTTSQYPNVEVRTYKGSGPTVYPKFMLTAGRGTGSSGAQSALQSGDVLGVIEASGTDSATAFDWQVGGEIKFQTSQTWTDSAHGTDVIFSNTPDNSSTLTERMRISSNGNVGIGTGTPMQKLHVYQNTNADVVVDIENDFSGRATYLGLLANSLYSSITFGGSTQQWYAGLDGTSTFEIKDGTNSRAPFAIQSNAPTNSLFINSGGSIGVGTAAPSGKFSVGGAASDNVYLFYDNADIGDSNDGQSLYLYRRAAEGDGHIRTYIDQYNYARVDTDTHLFFHSLTNYTNPNFTGTYPEAYNATEGARSTPRAFFLNIENYTATNGAASGLLFVAHNAANVLPHQAAYIYGVSTASGSSAELAFGQRTSSSSTAERMRLDASGNLGIGTTTPGERLTVAGNLQVTGGQAYVSRQTSSAASPLTFNANSGNTMVWSNSDNTPTVNIHHMKPGGNYTLVVTGTGTGAVSINCYSDAGSTSLPSSFVPANGGRVAGTLNKTLYTLISDGVNCLITWVTGF